METKELWRNGAAEAPSRPAACLRGRGAPPRAADGEGQSEGSATRRVSIRHVEAEGEVVTKGSMEEGEGASERRSVVGLVGEGGDARRCHSALKRITFVFCFRLGFAMLSRKRWA